MPWMNLGISIIYVKPKGAPPHCNENPICVFPEKELCGLSPNFHIHVSLGDLLYYQDWSTYFPVAE